MGLLGLLHCGSNARHRDNAGGTLMDVSETNYTMQRLVEAAFAALEMEEGHPLIQVTVKGGAEGATLVLLTFLVPDGAAKEAVSALSTGILALEPALEAMERTPPPPNQCDA